ncbi:unnamed protein product [Meloidogyne enterolobii]|uniref:Uncharacterized protein n=1 Tax=Meloidogyne enterolobii TaxID=390850 RepID=A0ACB0XXQ7_MELEN
MLENTVISKSKFIFSILIFLSTFLYFLYIFVFNQIIFPAKDGDDKLPGWLKRMSVPVKWPPPTILMWNKMFGASLSESLIKYNNNKQCSYKCIYTDNRSLYAEIILSISESPKHRR